MDVHAGKGVCTELQRQRKRRVLYLWMVLSAPYSTVQKCSFVFINQNTTSDQASTDEYQYSIVPSSDTELHSVYTCTYLLYTCNGEQCSALLYTCTAESRVSKLS